MTKDELQALIEAIHETGRMLAASIAPWPAADATTMTLPTGGIVSVGDYRQADLTFDHDGRLVGGGDAVLGQLKEFGDVYQWRPRESGWNPPPPWIITRIACAADVEIVFTARHGYVHVFRGRDLVIGRPVRPVIVVQDHFDWSVRASAPARVVISGLVRVA